MSAIPIHHNFKRKLEEMEPSSFETTNPGFFLFCIDRLQKAAIEADQLRVNRLYQQLPPDTKSQLLSESISKGEMQIAAAILETGDVAETDKQKAIETMAILQKIESLFEDIFNIPYSIRFSNINLLKRCLNSENNFKYNLVDMTKFIHKMTTDYKKNLDKHKALLYIYGKFIKLVP